MAGDKTKPLDDAHDEIDGGAHVICFEAADERVKGARGGTYPHQERYLDKQEDEGAYQADDAEDDEQVEVEDVGDSESKAQNYANHTSPLSIDTEVARPKLFSNRHVGGVRSSSRSLAVLRSCDLAWRDVVLKERGGLLNAPDGF